MKAKIRVTFDLMVDERKDHDDYPFTHSEFKKEVKATYSNAILKDILNRSDLVDGFNTFIAYGVENVRGGQVVITAKKT